MTTSSITPQGAHPLPSSPERDARQGDDHSHIAPGEIAVGVIIGRASEYFDFFVYGIASVLVFPAVFFPFEQHLEGVLYSFLIFSFAFIARPFGTVISMAIQRRFGREAKLTLALFVLGTSTAGIAFLPATRAWASRPSCCCRCSASARAWRWAARGTACRRCWR
jgi:MFS family permease